MRCLCLALLVCASLASACADAPQLDLESSWVWGREVCFAGHMTDGMFSSFVQWRDSLEDLSRRAVTFGVSLPWVLIGPLAPMGLFREAANPFGFAPASQVFSERTGFQLDSSLPPGDMGIVCMPVADVLGLYCRLVRDDLPEYGCFASFLSQGGFGAEGLVSFSSPPPGEFGEEWYRAAALFPGGTLLIAAGRCMIVLPWFAMEAAAHASFGERVEPGASWHLQASARGARVQAALLFSRVEGRPVEPGGTEPGAECQFAFSAGAALSGSTAKLGYTITVARAGFVPRPFRQTTEKVTLTLERSLWHASGLQLLARAEAEKRIDADEYGSREETTSSRWSIKGRVRILELMAGVAVAEGEGIGLFLSAFLPGAGSFPRASLAAHLDRLDAVRPELTAYGSVRLESGGMTLTLQPGIDRMPMAADGSAWTDHLTMRADFCVRTTAP